MRPSVIAGVAVLACLLIVIALFLFDGETAPAPDSPYDPFAGAPSTAADVGKDSRPAALMPRPIVAKAFEEVDAHGLGSGDALRVLVVDGSGFPVPGAEVAWGDARDDAGVFRIFASSELVENFDNAPNKTVANSRGIVMVKAMPRLVVAGRKDHLFGFARFTAPRGEVRLSLASGIVLAARVVTPGGAPAPGIRVWFSLSRSSSEGPRCVVSRSPDGLAISHHARDSTDSPDLSAEVCTSHRGKQPSGWMKVPLSDLTRGAVTLVAPPTGRVVVKVLGPDGTPLLSPVDVLVKATPTLFTHRGRTKNGTAAFDVVPSGTALVVSASAASFDSAIQHLDALSDGEERVAELRFQNKMAVLVGRVIDKSGTPLAAQTLAVELSVDREFLLLQKRLNAETDAAGNFELAIDRSMVPASGCDLDFEINPTLDVVECVGTIALPTLSQNGKTSLGDVCMEVPALLAFGTVVDELGAPIPGARVGAFLKFDHGHGGITISAGRSRSPGFRETLTDGSGKYTIPLPARVPGRVRAFDVRADFDGFVCLAPRANVTPGWDSVKLVLHGAGSIEGTLLLPDPAPVRMIDLLVTRTDPEASEGPSAQRFEDCVDSSGSFRVNGILPGSVTVTIRKSGVTEPLATITEVEVPRLDVADDSRLHSIDLRRHPALRPGRHGK